MRTPFVLRGHRPRGALLTVVVAGILAGAALGGGGRAARAQSSLSIAFGPSDVWMPSRDATTALHQCVSANWTCVAQVMQQEGASADAMAFYQLTGWFLADIQNTGLVQLGTVFNPWAANENDQPVLLGGIPAVVLPHIAAQTDNFEGTVEHADGYDALKAAHPNIMFWAPGPKFVEMDMTDDGGQSFVFDYRLLDGCHACAILAYARFAFDFGPDGTNEGTRFLGLIPNPPQ
jgi:hypothetical protein